MACCYCLELFEVLHHYPAFFSLSNEISGKVFIKPAIKNYFKIFPGKESKVKFYFSLHKVFILLPPPLLQHTLCILVWCFRNSFQIQSCWSSKIIKREKVLKVKFVERKKKKRTEKLLTILSQTTVICPLIFLKVKLLKLWFCVDLRGIIHRELF